MAMSAKEKTARWNQFVVWYEANVSARPGGKPIPKELKTLYMAKEGAWDTDRAMMWIRLHDPNYIRTETAQGRISAIQSLYEKALGYKINWESSEMKKYSEAFARANPNMDVNMRLTQIFMKRILPSAEFKKKNPGFVSWLGKNRQSYTDATSIVAALDAYNTHAENLSDFWASKSTEPMPKSLLDKALANDWESDNLQFLQEMTSSREWAAGASYADRAQEFQQNWSSIFGDKVPVDGAMADRYARNASGLTFSDFFHTNLKNSAVFTENMPGYTEWEVKQHAAGTPEGSVDIFDYFTRRNELVELWNESFTGGELPDEATISKALSENWGDALFRNKVRSLPQYANSGVGKERAAKFDQYWTGLFGEGAAPDQALRSRFIGSETSDPSVYWDDIKQTDRFKAQFQNYDIFAKAQSSVGITVNQDPAAYKQYQEEFRKAFEDIGVEVPDGMDKTIFASGVSGQDIANRAETWKTTGKAYELQTGQKADLAGTLGVAGNKAQSGDMRIRMQQALEKQRKIQNSKFAKVDSDKQQQTGFIKQNI
jgi:hypothetical protein